MPFLWDAYFCMGAYKCDVVTVKIKMGANHPNFIVYIPGVVGEMVMND